MSSDSFFLRKIRPLSRTLTVSKTRPADTTVYADGDAISESTSAGTVWTFANMAREQGGGGILQGADLIISTSQTLKLDAELWLFDTAPASGLNDNGAWTPSDAEMKTKLCIVTFSGGAWKSGSGNGTTEVQGLAVSYACAAGSTTLYGVLRARNGYTPTSAEEITLRLHTILD